MGATQNENDDKFLWKLCHLENSLVYTYYTYCIYTLYIFFVLISFHLSFGGRRIACSSTFLLTFCTILIFWRLEKFATKFIRNFFVVETLTGWNCLSPQRPGEKVDCHIRIPKGEKMSLFIYVMAMVRGYYNGVFKLMTSVKT